MTLASRNMIILMGLAAGILFLISASIGFYFAFSQDPQFTHVKHLDFQPWWLLHSKQVANEFMWCLVGIFTILVFSSGSGFALWFNFRKTASPEIFFFSLFILFLSLESLRLFQLNLLAANTPVYFGVLLTKIIYFFRFASLFSLLISSLYSIGIQQQSFSIILSITLFLSATLSAALPVDPTALFANLLYKLGAEREIFFATFALKILAIANYIWAGFVKSSKDHLYMALGIGNVLAGRELLLFAHTPLTIVLGFVCIAGGAFLFAKKNHDLYLWM